MSKRLPNLLLCLLICSLTSLYAAPRNIVVFLVDDMGWTDLGCYGSDFHETPNIDALASDAVRFTNSYAACTVCSPTRAALLTGQYPARLRVTDFIPGHPFVNTPLSMPDWTPVLEHRHTTLPEILKPAGYVSAHLGKWHLTRRDRSAVGGGDNSDPDNYPDRHGFDLNIGGCESGAPGSYFWPYGSGRTLETKKENNIFKTLPPGTLSESEREGEYLTDRLASEAEALLDQFAKEQTPFFLNLWFYNVHTPLMGRPDLVEKYEAKLAQNPETRHNNVKYAAMVESVDEAVGRVVSKLRDSGAYEDTLIVFSSDNGGLKPHAVDNHPLRQGKGGIYEGGVRVPTIIRLPGAARKNSICDEAVITVDFLPTILDYAGIPLPAEVAAVQDGISLLPLLNDPGTASGREDIFWHYPHYHSGGAQPYSAIRSGDWKLIELHDGSPLELYHLADDIHEDTNLTASLPDKTRELHEKLKSWRDRVGAQMPVPNPVYNPDKPTGISRGGTFREAAPLRDQGD